ncbi:MAG: class I SAM-dependent methyltransferase family protein [Clostridia bacterium]|nr:class I SAM-dependent methyltransferase family protein [Clostridia bacterium]
MNKIVLVGSKIFYHTIGRLSTGVNMTLKEGLTAGKVLDYIYENEPRGKTFIGRKIDKNYLNHVGWEAVRVRKRNIEILIKEAIKMAKKEKRKIKIVDIACGYASYLFSVLKELNDTDISVYCYDIEPRWVKAGNDKAAALKIKNIKFQQGDMLNEAFASKQLSDADIVISSGFYDWLVEDDTVIHSMKIIKNAAAPGANFVLSYQMDHPCLDLAQYAFSSFTGDPLKMKMRSKSEMGKMLEKAGVNLISEKSDKYEYYNTVLARC